jgi:hypothetical protein
MLFRWVFSFLHHVGTVINNRRITIMTVLAHCTMRRNVLYSVCAVCARTDQNSRVGLGVGRLVGAVEQQ